MKNFLHKKKKVGGLNSKLEGLCKIKNFIKFNKKLFLIAISCSIIAFFMDFASKKIIKNLIIDLYYRDGKLLIINEAYRMYKYKFLYISPIFNPGISFGMLSFVPFSRYIMSLTSFTIAIYVSISFILSGPKNCIFYILSGLLFGGSFGNIFGRVCEGYVLDFIEVDLPIIRMTIFNVADVIILISILFYLLYSFYDLYKNKTSSRKTKKI